MDLYVVIHLHKLESTVGLVESDHEPGDDEVMRALDLVWSTGDSVEIHLVQKTEIKTLPPLQPY